MGDTDRFKTIIRLAGSVPLHLCFQDHFRLSVSLILLLSLISANAGSDGSSPTVVKRILKKNELSILGLEVGLSKLRDVGKKYDQSKILHSGDAGTSQYMICHEGPDGTSINYISSAEMGGPQKTITTVDLISKGKSNRPECSQDKNVSSKLPLFGVRIGMREAEVIKLRGRRFIRSEGRIKYTYLSDEILGGIPFAITSILEIYFVQDAVVKVTLSKVESL